MNTPTPSSLPLSTGITFLVEQYRAGISTAGEELLTRFTPYLTKWNRLLLSGRWDGRDRELRHFLEMLGSVNLAVTANFLAFRLKCYEREDLEQEIKLALLETALASRSIRKQYRYFLKRRILAALRDPLTFNYHDTVVFTEDDALEAEEVGMQLGRISPLTLDQHWVDGTTAGPRFDQLTPTERQVLRYTKWLGYSNEETAGMLEVSLSTVNRAIRKSKLVLTVHRLE